MTLIKDLNISDIILNYFQSLGEIQVIKSVDGINTDQLWIKLIPNGDRFFNQTIGVVNINKNNYYKLNMFYFYITYNWYNQEEAIRRIKLLQFI